MGVHYIEPSVNPLLGWDWAVINIDLKRFKAAKFIQKEIGVF